ncbi:antimicrobial peptide NK-lysin isoform X1 [Bos mutus]
MTSWAVLLVTSVLLVAPGLAFSGLTPECHDQATAHLWDGDKLRQGLAPEDPQGDLVLQREELNQFCGPCQKIMQMLKYMVGNRPSKNVIIRVTSKVCSKMGLWSILCNQMMKKYLNHISKDIMARKTPQAICVDIKLCKRKAGTCRGNRRELFPDSFPANVQ